jgi:hypothetical protein
MRDFGIVTAIEAYWVLRRVDWKVLADVRPSASW